MPINDDLEICEGIVRIDSKGRFTFYPKDMEKCKKVLDQVNPKIGMFWKRHIPREYELECWEEQTLFGTKEVCRKKPKTNTVLY